MGFATGRDLGDAGGVYWASRQHISGQMQRSSASMLDVVRASEPIKRAASTRMTNGLGKPLYDTPDAVVE